MSKAPWLFPDCFKQKYNRYKREKIRIFYPRYQRKIKENRGWTEWNRVNDRTTLVVCCRNGEGTGVYYVSDVLERNCGKEKKEEESWRTRWLRWTRRWGVRIRAIRRTRRDRKTRARPTRSRRAAWNRNTRRRSLSRRSSNDSSSRERSNIRMIDRSWRAPSRRTSRTFWCSLPAGNCSLVSLFLTFLVGQFCFSRDSLWELLFDGITSESQFARLKVNFSLGN